MWGKRAHARIKGGFNFQESFFPFFPFAGTINLYFIVFLVTVLVCVRKCLLVFGMILLRSCHVRELAQDSFFIRESAHVRLSFPD